MNIKRFFALVMIATLLSVCSSALSETEFIGPLVAPSEYVPVTSLHSLLGVGDYVTFNNGIAVMFVGYANDIGIACENNPPAFIGRDDEGNAEVYLLGDEGKTDLKTDINGITFNILFSSMVWWSDVSA